MTTARFLPPSNSCWWVGRDKPWDRPQPRAIAVWDPFGIPFRTDRAVVALAVAMVARCLAGQRFSRLRALRLAFPQRGREENPPER